MPWRPESGRVFNTRIALDVETTLIDLQRDWVPPAYVLGAAYDGHRGYFLARENIAAFLKVHTDLPLVLHNAPFDLSVLQAVDSTIAVYDRVDRRLVHDTQLMHRSLTLAVAGHTARGKGQSTLEACSQQYLGAELPKTVKDSAGDDVRLSYSKWLNRRPHEIEPVYLEYLGKDVIATFWVHDELTRRLYEVLQSSNDVWGYVSPAWLEAQIGRWGLQTHDIQLKAAIVLRAIKSNGLWIDQEHREQLATQLDEFAEERRLELRKEGYLPGQPGSGKALQEILRRLEWKHPELMFPKTPTGQFATGQDVLEDLAAVEPFIRTLLQFKGVEKLQSTFLDKMGKRCLHPSFDPLMVTGRTSSFGEINAQNLPRDDRVRSCFVPSRGSVFIDADFATVEMATLAQSAMSQFGLPSAMAAAINAGRDLHTLVAARVTGKPELEVTSDERRKAKPINFGKPGGMGDAGLRSYAKASYGVELQEQEVRAFTDSWFDLFPEMKAFLKNSDDAGYSIANFFGLTPQSFFEGTGSRKYLDHPENYGHENTPRSFMGWMLRKVLFDSAPRTGRGEDYDADTISYFWDRANTRIACFDKSVQNDLSLHIPSPKLGREVLRLAGQQPCFTLTGRLRANASFCARHNTVFQGLAADGAKLALWRLWRAGYRIVNFVHDEVLIEVPEDSDLRSHAETIRRHMIEGMREVVPDVRIEVEYTATQSWSKSAKSLLDVVSQLLPETHLDTNANQVSAPSSLSATIA